MNIERILKSSLFLLFFLTSSINNWHFSYYEYSNNENQTHRQNGKALTLTHTHRHSKVYTHVNNVISSSFATAERKKSNILRNESKN